MRAVCSRTALALATLLPCQALAADDMDVLAPQDVAAINKMIDVPDPVLSVQLQGMSQDKSADFGQGEPTAGSCKLQRFMMTLSNDKSGGGRQERNFNVLADSGKPDILMLKVAHLAVDADGSPRAYHPLDAHGTCAPGSAGPCALDDLHGSAGVEMCGRPSGGASPVCYSGESFAKKFAAVWPSIRGNPPASSQGERYDYRVGDGRYLVSFKSNIIPQNAKDKSPCLNKLDYFLSVSSLSQKVKDTESDEPAGCSYVTPDAENVPFLVIPRSAFAANKTGSIDVGDLVVAHYEKKGKSRLTYAVVGDQGPKIKFGEGSIGLAQALHDEKIKVVKRSDLEGKLDIGDGQVTFLILGGSRKELGRNFGLDHIAEVGDRLFKDWLEGDDKSRFASCLTQAKLNKNGD